MLGGVDSEAVDLILGNIGLNPVFERLDDVGVFSVDIHEGEVLIAQRTARSVVLWLQAAFDLAIDTHQYSTEV